MKSCAKCGQIKAETAFRKSKRSLDGIQSTCKQCVRRITISYCAEHPAESIGKRLAWSHNRRARNLGVAGEISHQSIDRLYDLQRGKCPCCGLPLGDNYHLDHIMPLALGGTNTDDNIQLLRQECNNQKRAKHPIDFMQRRGFLL